jgi:hypothetical protein
MGIDVRSVDVRRLHDWPRGCVGRDGPSAVHHDQGHEVEGGVVRLTRAERQQDEMIIAKIISAAATSGRAMRPAYSNLERPEQVGTNAGFMSYDHDGPACAVGMGCIFGGIVDRNLPPGRDWVDLFAEFHGVSDVYASAVSDGFEGHSFGVDTYNQYRTRDFARGYAVGVALYYSTQVAP